MRIYFQVALTAQFKINDRMFRKERQHVIKEWDSCLDGSLARTVQLELNFDPGFFRVSLQSRLPNSHDSS